MTIAFLARTPFYDKIINGQYNSGLYNGYVAFDKKLPATWQSQAEYEDPDALDNKLKVHGGITYDKLYSDNRIPMIPLTAIPEPEILSALRVIGFDTLHYGDTKEIWNFDAVKEETLQLLKQIENL